MIAERARSVRVDIDTLQELAVNARLRDNLEERREALSGIVGELASAQRMVAYWTERGHVLDLGDLDLTRTLAAIDALKTAFLNDVNAIVDGDPFSDTKHALEQSVARVSRRLEDVWREYVAAHEPLVKEEQLDVLGRIRSFVPQVETIRRQLAAMRVAARQAPGSPQEVAAFDAASAGINSELQRLQGDASMPGEVLAFVRACTSDEGARVGDLTPVVHDWLDQHDLLDSLRVHL